MWVLAIIMVALLGRMLTVPATGIMMVVGPAVDHDTWHSMW